MTLSIVDFLNQRLKDDEDQALDRGHEPLRYGIDKVTDSTLSDRVLREVAAKRAIIKAHPIDTEYDHVAACRACQWDVDCDAPEQDLEPSDCPCPTLRNLAAVYEGHESYREAWKP